MVAKARLVEVRWKPNSPEVTYVKGANDLDVQFNPQTLKIVYSVENKGGKQPGGSDKQFVGQGSSKLSVELLFDSTQSGDDVRWWTAKVAHFVGARRQSNSGANKRTPPGASFEWGTFKFAGMVDSLQETLDFFSEEGVPLRATVALGMTAYDIVFPDDAGKPGAAKQGLPGTAPLNAARPGDNLARMAGRDGHSADYKAIAAGNDIDDTLSLPAGRVVDMNARPGSGTALAAGASASLASGAGLGAEAGFSAGLGAGLGFGAGLSAGAGAASSAGAGAGFSAGASAGADAGAGFGANAGMGFGASAAAGTGAGLSAGAGVGAGLSAGASAGVQAGVGLDAAAGFRSEADFSAGQ